MECLLSLSSGVHLAKMLAAAARIRAWSGVVALVTWGVTQADLSPKRSLISTATYLRCSILNIAPPGAPTV